MDFWLYCEKIGAIDGPALDKIKGLDLSDAMERLISDGDINQERLAVLAGEYYGLPAVDLSRINVESGAATYGSLAECQEDLFLPFAMDPISGLMVAVADPTRIDRISEYLNVIQAGRFRFYVAPYVSLVTAVQRTYGDNGIYIELDDGTAPAQLMREPFVDMSSDIIMSLKKRVDALELKLARQEETIARLIGAMGLDVEI